MAIRGGRHSREHRVAAAAATIPDVPRLPGDLTPEQERRLKRDAKKVDQVQEAYRATVVAVLAEGASFSRVAAATGLSTNTLQRWKREATA